MTQPTDKPRVKRGPYKKTAPQRELREMVRTALELCGGVSYLEAVAKSNPQSFLALLGKCLPKEVDAQVDTTITIGWVKPEEQA